MGQSTHNFIHHVISRAFLVTTFILALAACSSPASPTPDQSNPSENTDIQNASAPDSFGYETLRNVSLNISSEDLFAQPIANSVISVYHSYDLAQNDYGQEVLVALTDAQGRLTTNLVLPSHIESVLVVLDAVGIPNVLEVPVSEAMTVNFAPTKERADVDRSDFSVQLYKNNTLGSWSSKYGFPDYLMEKYPIKPSQRVFDLIKSSFPSGKSVAEHHPSYLLDNVETNLVFTEDTEVIVSFIHEGAGYKNTFAYYTYDAKNPPTSPDDIDNLTIIFPNSSYYGSGGYLLSGDRVKLNYGVGTKQASTVFPAGTALGWAVVADGWQVKGNKGQLTDGKAIYYSKTNLNPDESQHMVVLYDEVDKLLILGAEDLDRKDPKTDHDFDDLIFKVDLSNPDALKTEDMAIVDTGKEVDTDKDGVSDSFDHYPNDKSKAFNSYYPSKNGFSTLAFEDRWPLEGDYDFNDLVVDYRINQVMNAANKVVELNAEFKFRAAGAAFTNAFAFELPVPYSSVASVTGSHFADPNGSYNYIQRNANGTEAGQDKAVIFVSDDVGALLGYLVNTEKSGAKADSKTVTMTVSFTEPQDKANFLPPYNPFIVTNVDSLVIAATGEERATKRGHEIHLPNHAPTQLADMSLFGTLDDQSKPKKDQWYVTKNNKLPWALHIPDSFDYLIEKEQVSAGYKHFVQWVNTGGKQHPDWYTDKEGYRNESLIY